MNQIRITFAGHPEAESLKLHAKRLQSEELSLEDLTTEGALQLTRDVAGIIYDELGDAQSVGRESQQGARYYAAEEVEVWLVQVKYSEGLSGFYPFGGAHLDRTEPEHLLAHLRQFCSDVDWLLGEDLRVDIPWR